MNAEQKKVWDILSTPYKTGIRTVKPMGTVSILYGSNTGLIFNPRAMPSLGNTQGSTATHRGRDVDEPHSRSKA
jgi:hypothetical protein